MEQMCTHRSRHVAHLLTLHTTFAIPFLSTVQFMTIISCHVSQTCPGPQATNNSYHGDNIGLGVRRRGCAEDAARHCYTRRCADWIVRWCNDHDGHGGSFQLIGAVREHGDDNHKNNPIHEPYPLQTLELHTQAVSEKKCCCV